MSRFILRVWLPDRPGALGIVASRVGAAGGEIVGIDILERGAGRVIDELVVELPDESYVQLLVREVRAVDDVDVEDLRQAPESRRDPAIAGVETAAELVTATHPQELLDRLVEHSGINLQAQWAALVDHAETCIRSSTGTTPSALWLKAFVDGIQSSPSLAGQESGPREVAWAPLLSAGQSLVLGRPARPFRALERRQLVVLARIADTRWVEVSRPLARV
ncbi:MAG TPA: hypothetical protein VNT56_12320 [Acidimicrobiales bacterium]|jgi:hypothetical protein|nr:hypothetical protein [Acidimicrobiales bacterium]